MFFEQFKRFLTFGGLVKCGIFFDNSNYVADYIGKCSDKTAVVIGKFYECLDVSNSYKGLSILNSFNYLGIYADIFGRNDQS